MMFVLALGLVLTVALLLAFLFSAFIFFIILTSKQYKNSTSLLHLQLMGAGVLLSLLFVIFTTPSIIQGRWLLKGSLWPGGDSPRGHAVLDGNDSTSSAALSSPTLEEASACESPPDAAQQSDVVCRLYGFLLVTLHTVAVWVVVGLHCDKYCAIATPLRYNQLVTRPRVAICSALAWMLGVGLAVPPLATSYGYTYTQGVCLPAWFLPEAAAYTWTLTACCIVLPFVIILIVNTRIVLIARHHQHRIFSAIFEVMMSAQATVTHQKNPFDIPKKKRKSVWTVLEQIAAFVACYCPFFCTVAWESLHGRCANQYWVLLGTAPLLATPLVNSFIYGFKCKNIRKAFRNYLRKKLYKTEMKHEIQARIPSASNSRRPSISSTLAMPILHRSLQRRMSDYLLQDAAAAPQPKLVRRSSDLSWHPLEDGTPSPTRLRRPMDTTKLQFAAAASSEGSRSPASMSNFLTVPTFEAARSYCLGQQRVRLSLSSLDSETSITLQDEDFPGQASLLHPDPELGMPKSRSLELPLANQRTQPTSDKVAPDCQTPLLFKAFEKPARSASLNSSSPHVLRTLEAILSVRISQSLLRRGSGWGGSQGSLERLSAFLRDSRRPASNCSPASLRRQQAVEDTDLSVLTTFITPLANGNACVAPCDQEPRETPLLVP
ncbi:uncharacterized protein LOC123512670 [Portunus trituberculatus]|uniref:uncharacterized protein LOC123512670 n=1 Tax=Portunus trituberculatus TaxID=210409 RepID=UPI001E1D1C97|nr:uncharacterized protein LOC123512670 [Portunus trituberculatus]